MSAIEYFDRAGAATLSGGLIALVTFVVSAYISLRKDRRVQEARRIEIAKIQKQIAALRSKNGGDTDDD